MTLPIHPIIPSTLQYIALFGWGKGGNKVGYCHKRLHNLHRQQLCMLNIAVNPPSSIPTTIYRKTWHILGLVRMVINHDLVNFEAVINLIKIFNHLTPLIYIYSI